MIIYPAIDLRDGKCVRLFKGDFATTKIYHESPAAMLESFAAAGSEWVHLVDLDGAKAGKFTQGALIRELVANSRLKIEVGGGIRETADLEQLFASGVARVVIGSVCVSNPALVRQWLEQFGAERIVLALDCSLAADGTPKVLTHGWQQEKRSLEKRGGSRNHGGARAHCGPFGCRHEVQRTRERQSSCSRRSG